MFRKINWGLIGVLLFGILFWVAVVYATTFSFTYDTATPAGSDDPAEADDRMREIKAAVQERLAVEHRFALTGTEVSAADTGEHTDITCDSIVNAGAYSGTTIAASGNATVGGTLDIQSTTAVVGVLDEDDMATDSATNLATQQSIKAYADSLSTPYGKLSVSGTVSIPNNTVTQILFDATDFDSGSIVTEGAGAKITPGVAGIYKITLNISVPNMDDGEHITARIDKNTAITAQESTWCSTGSNTVLHASCSVLLSLNATDYVRGVVFHNEGASQNLVATTTNLSLARVGI